MDFMETVSFESGAGHDSFLEGETLLDDTLPIARRKPPALVVVAPAEGAAVDPNLTNLMDLEEALHGTPPPKEEPAPAPPAARQTAAPEPPPVAADVRAKQLASPRRTWPLIVGVAAAASLAGGVVTFMLSRSHDEARVVHSSGSPTAVEANHEARPPPPPAPEVIKVKVKQAMTSDAAVPSPAPSPSAGAAAPKNEAKRPPVAAVREAPPTAKTAPPPSVKKKRVRRSRPRARRARKKSPRKKPVVKKKQAAPKSDWVDPFAQ